MKCIALLFFLTITISNIFSIKGLAEEKPRSNKKINKALSRQMSLSYIDINNISAIQTNNGFSDYYNITKKGGFEYPKGSGKTAVYQSGLLWGGFIQIDPHVRVGGSAYFSGLQPGPILSNGHAAVEPYSNSNWRIYRVRRDIYPSGPGVDLLSEAELEGAAPEVLRNQYEKDWLEWPAAGSSNDLGAPFSDVNHNGIYEPDIDIPGLEGADQTIYFVANDLDSILTDSLAGTKPLGIELRATYWGYAQAGPLGNIYFKKYLLINKGYQHYTIDSMFVSFWTDPDLGNNMDDYGGTDSTLNLVYTYNGIPSDAIYNPNIPPCAGFSLLQGPIIDGNAEDRAIFEGRILHGKKNLLMTASYLFFPEPWNNYDPVDISLEYYNAFNGKTYHGFPFMDLQGHVTKFIYPGDPVTGEGWIQSQLWPPSDVRQGIASGPFTFAPGDTQEVVFSEMIGESADFLHSIYAVKKYLYYYAADLYKNIVKRTEVPTPNKAIFSISNNNNSVQIIWDNSAEHFSRSGYTFEGYNIYQLASPYDTKQKAKLIGTFDKVDGVTSISGMGINGQEIQQFGTDSGIQNSFTAVKDYIYDSPFIKGKDYYFAVTSYTYNYENIFQNNTENVIEAKSVSYNHNLPGANYNDTLNIIHVSGSSDNNITVRVADPSKLTGHSYKIYFTQDVDSLLWSLTDITINKILISKQSIENSQVNIDGLFIDVLYPKTGIKKWSCEPDTVRWFTGHGNFGYFFGGLDAGINFFFGSDVKNYIPIVLKFVGAPNSPSIEAGWSQGAVYRRDKSFAYQGVGWLPVTAWDYSDSNNLKQINLSFVEDTSNGTANNQWDLGWNGSSFMVNGGREYLFINNTPYDPHYYNADVDGRNTDVLYALWPEGRPGYSYLDGAFNFYIYPTFSFTVKDEFSFISPSPVMEVISANNMSQYSLLQNYPNPFNSATIIEYSVSKTDLVTIKVYDILGRGVETLVNAEKSPGNYKIEFDGSKLSSGVYFYRMQACNFTDVKKFLLIK